MFKKDGGYDLRTSAGRAGKEQSDELMFVLVIFALKIVFSFALILGMRVLWEALLDDFYVRLLQGAGVQEPGFLSHAVVICLTTFVTLYTPYAFVNHLRALKNDELGFILSTLSIGLRWVLPAWFVFIKMV